MQISLDLSAAVIHTRFKAAVGQPLASALYTCTTFEGNLVDLSLAQERMCDD